VQPDGTFHNLYRTDYFDAGGIKNQQFSWQYVFNPGTGYTSTEGQLANSYLKVMVNLKPLDNPAAQNVLFVARYPVTQQTVSSFAALPPATCGVLAQASPGTIAALCSSSKYQQAIHAATDPANERGGHKRCGGARYCATAGHPEPRHRVGTLERLRGPARPGAPEAER
jgi:hypothetical protein